MLIFNYINKLYLEKRLFSDYVCDFETNDAQACIFYQQILNTISWNRVSVSVMILFFAKLSK